MGISGCSGEGKREGKKRPKLNTFVSALTYHKSYENRGLIVFTLQVPPLHHHPTPPPSSTPPPPVLSSSSPPPPYTHSCLQMPPVFALRLQAQISRPRRLLGPASSQILLPDIPITPLLTPLTPLSVPSPPARPAACPSNSAQTHRHIHTPQVCFDTRSCRAGTQRLTVGNSYHLLLLLGTLKKIMTKDIIKKESNGFKSK